MKLEPLFNPPYYAAIFSCVRTGNDTEGYQKMADFMYELAETQPGFLGVDSARADIGIVVSYWKDLESLKLWRSNLEHQKAQKSGRTTWYKSYTVRVARVEREYDFES